MSPAIPAECVLPEPAEELSIRSAEGNLLHAAVFGAPAAPTVVLAHGWTCSIAFWAPVIRQLAGDYRLVAYDQRGHGRSERPSATAGYTTRALADDLEAVVTRAVPAGERAVLVGHSMGGMTIMAAGGRSEVAARTAAALLVSTGSRDLVPHLRVAPDALRSPALRRFVHRRVMQSRLPLGPVSGVSRALLKYATMGPASTPDLVEATARIVHACPTAVRTGWAGLLEELDVTDGLARLAAPTAVLVGTEDRLTPPVHSHRIVAGLPDPQGLLLLPGVGHMSPMERPAAVAGEIHRLAAAYLPAQRAAGPAESAADHSADPSVDPSVNRSVDPAGTTGQPVERSVAG